ncbi:MAG: superoxide dismutase [Gammaproteobacteria bacterium]|nr:superoxide dismutase [Gammaproteobacteria bacterium]
MASDFHTLPKLPYSVTALEPYIDAETIMVHHKKHHAKYVKELNEALTHLPEFQDKSLEWLLNHLNAIPDSSRTAIRNNAGGHYNHSLYWQMMSPNNGGSPTGELAKSIKETFGSISKFKSEFEDKGNKIFGSGWVWLIKPSHNSAALEIITTSGHDTPLMERHIPLLLNDVWEHAYYLQYKNSRADYLKKWWSITNWSEVEKRYDNT